MSAKNNESQPGVFRFTGEKNSGRVKNVLPVVFEPVYNNRLNLKLCGN